MGTRWQTAHYCHPKKVVHRLNLDQLCMLNSGFDICKEVAREEIIIS